MESQSQSEQQEEVPFYVDRALVKHDSEAGLKRRQQSVRDGCTFDPDQLWSGRTNPEPFCHRSVSQELRGRRCQLPVGTLLMVKAGRWPWWPAVLSPDPESGECVKLGGDGGMQKYHVEFLGSPRTRFWASPKSTELYHAPCANPRAMRGSLKRSYVIAMEEAVQMKDVPCEVRLQMCHFRPTNKTRLSSRLLPGSDFLRQQNKVKQETLAMTKKQPARGQKQLSIARDDRQLIRQCLINWRMTSSDLQKQWETLSGVKCTARTVCIRLLEAGLKTHKARKKPFINEKQGRARLEFAKKCVFYRGTYS
ncbi:zinc finger CW-type PWWP domain protein 2 homolog isoform X1 [Paramormyrops kingsleyae]|uniref:zinc finger CW-type PWWP domain protein 2 homolog isoform X1 n=1 Tax=Paramormyrops kingsleyae TaxID=1676925 RepID=UPI003B96D8A9